MIYTVLKAMKWITEIMPIIHYVVFQNVLGAKLEQQPNQGMTWQN